MDGPAADGSGAEAKGSGTAECGGTRKGIEEDALMKRLKPHPLTCGRGSRRAAKTPSRGPIASSRRVQKEIQLYPHVEHCRDYDSHIRPRVQREPNQDHHPVDQSGGTEGKAGAGWRLCEDAREASGQHFTVGREPCSMGTATLKLIDHDKRRLSRVDLHPVIKQVIEDVRAVHDRQGCEGHVKVSARLALPEGE